MRKLLKPVKWKGFRRILCPIDFSETAAAALRYGAAIAKRHGGTMTVAYVNDPLLVTAASIALHDRRMARRSARELRDFVAAVLPIETTRPLRLKLRVSVGPPADEILRAGALGFDLIVMGTQGLSGVNRLLLGSTTLRVLRGSNVPVLAVPRRLGQRAAVPASWPGPRMLAAIEYGPQSRQEAENAGRIARSFGATLLLVHVIEELQVPPWLRADIADRERARFAKAQQWFDRIAAGAGPSVGATARVVSGDPADEIAVIAAAEQAQLLITALHDRQSWWQPSRGAISYRILTEAAVPVLACPPRCRLH